MGISSPSSDGRKTSVGVDAMEAACWWLAVRWTLIFKFVVVVELFLREADHGNIIPIL